MVKDGDLKKFGLNFSKYANSEVAPLKCIFPVKLASNMT